MNVLGRTLQERTCATRVCKQTALPLHYAAGNQHRLDIVDSRLLDHCRGRIASVPANERNIIGSKNDDVGRFTRC
jgi:hypothetical protein